MLRLRLAKTVRGGGLLYARNVRKDGRRAWIASFVTLICKDNKRKITRIFLKILRNSFAILR